jgi:hypothetical protein
MSKLMGFLALLVAGCGSAGMGDVSGSVTVDGATPAEGSSITFVPIDVKSSGGGATLKDGKYSVALPVGNYRVEIRVPKPLAAKPVATAKGPGGPGPGGPANIQESLPAKYHDKSELTIEVKPGSNEKNWELQTK